MPFRQWFKCVLYLAGYAGGEGRDPAAQFSSEAGDRWGGTQAVDGAA